jgi:very-short-patch-repair endonuclease
LFPETTPLTQ